MACCYCGLTFASTSVNENGEIQSVEYISHFAECRVFQECYQEYKHRALTKPCSIVCKRLTKDEIKQTVTDYVNDVKDKERRQRQVKTRAVNRMKSEDFKFEIYLELNGCDDKEIFSHNNEEMIKNFVQVRENLLKELEEKETVSSFDRVQARFRLIDDDESAHIESQAPVETISLQNLLERCNVVPQHVEAMQEMARVTTSRSQESASIRQSPRSSLPVSNGHSPVTTESPVTNGSNNEMIQVPIISTISTSEEYSVVPPNQVSVTIPGTNPPTNCVTFPIQFPSIPSSRPPVPELNPIAINQPLRAYAARVLTPPIIRNQSSIRQPPRRMSLQVPNVVSNGNGLQLQPHHHLQQQQQQAEHQPLMNGLKVLSAQDINSRIQGPRMEAYHTIANPANIKIKLVRRSQQLQFVFHIDGIETEFANTNANNQQQIQEHILKYFIPTLRSTMNNEVRIPGGLSQLRRQIEEIFYSIVPEVLRFLFVN